MNKISVTRWNSPIGEMLLGSCGDSVCLCDWINELRRDTIDRRICRILAAEYFETMSPVIVRMIEELTEYFAGKRTEFDLPVQFAGTEFQQRVWSELQKIPYGTTISYAEQARRIGNPNAIRAVAAANAANPISILVPCHRVIGSNHKLTGYGGGLFAKQALLELERRTIGIEHSLFQ